MFRIKTLAIATILSTALASAAHAESTLLFTGASVTEDSYYLHVGGVNAINGDLKKEGWLLRGTAAYGGYTYDRSAGVSDVDGNVAAVDLMMGYQTFLNNVRLSGYLGGDYQNHDLSPHDPVNPVRGSQAGVKGQVEAAADLGNQFSAKVIGSYSSAFQTYWSRLSVGYDVGAVIIGPEVLLMGSRSYDQQRYGAFISEVALFPGVKAGGSIGYSNSTRRGGNDSAYGEINLSTQF